MRWLRYLWISLITGSIIFAAGISGTWLNAQMPETLATWRWGWLGAALAGLTVFGGVVLAQRKQRIGWIVALTGALVDVLIDVQFFTVSHDLVMSIALGVFPMLIAVLAGVVEGRNLVVDLSKQEQFSEKRADWQLREEAKIAAHQRKLETLRVKTELERPMPLFRSVEQNGGTGKNDKITQLEKFLSQQPEASYTDIVNGTGIARSTAHRLITETGWKKNGAGWELVN